MTLTFGTWFGFRWGMVWRIAHAYEVGTDYCFWWGTWVYLKYFHCQCFCFAVIIDHCHYFQWARWCLDPHFSIFSQITKSEIVPVKVLTTFHARVNCRGSCVKLGSRPIYLYRHHRSVCLKIVRKKGSCTVDDHSVITSSSSCILLYYSGVNVGGKC